jgi:hypothetical protein
MGHMSTNVPHGPKSSWDDYMTELKFLATKAINLAKLNSWPGDIKGSLWEQILPAAHALVRDSKYAYWYAAWMQNFLTVSKAIFVSWLKKRAPGRSYRIAFACRSICNTVLSLSATHTIIMDWVISHGRMAIIKVGCDAINARFKDVCFICPGSKHYRTIKRVF